MAIDDGQSSLIHFVPALQRQVRVLYLTERKTEKFLGSLNIKAVSSEDTYKRKLIDRLIREPGTNGRNIPLSKLSPDQLDSLYQECLELNPHLGFDPIREQMVRGLRQTAPITLPQGKNLDVDRVEGILNELVVDQQDAVREVCDGLAVRAAGFWPEERPLCFMLTGPSGVGKTMLVRETSNVLGIPYRKFNCAEYSHGHEISGLVGAPPGYVGYGKGGKLTDFLDNTEGKRKKLDWLQVIEDDICMSLDRLELVKLL
jgi:hypothetical protein